MNVKELKAYKELALTVHADAAERGLWTPVPDWRARATRLLTAVTDAAFAWRHDRRAEWAEFEAYVERLRAGDTRKWGWVRSPRTFYDAAYENCVLDTVESGLARFVVESLDTMQGYCPDWGDNDLKLRSIVQTVNAHPHFEDVEDFDVWAFHLAKRAMVDGRYWETGTRYWDAFDGMEQVRRYAELRGIDLARAIEALLTYDEVLPLPQ